MNHIKTAMALLAVGVVVLIALFFWREWSEDSYQQDTSDAATSKGTIRIGMDNWVGYFPLCSPEMRKRQRQSAYTVICDNDNADMKQRFQRLDRGELDFAVASVDSYLLNAAQYSFPGTIIMVIDESKGGDAVVAWTDKVDNLDSLKGEVSVTNPTGWQMPNIAFTPDSPSHHLLKVIGSHFDVPALRQPVSNAPWAIATDGSEAALEKLLNRETDVAVLWEPDVAKALVQPEIKTLLSTESLSGVIVDVLVVNRRFAQKSPDAVKALLRNYFRTLKFYRDNPDKLNRDIRNETGLAEQQVDSMLQGVSWVNLSGNAQRWFGVGKNSYQEALIDTIESSVDVLVQTGDFNRNPLVDSDPYRIVNSQFISELQTLGIAEADSGETPADSLQRPFSTLSEAAWNQLEPVGTLTVRPITFQSGTDMLTLDGKEQVDAVVKHMQHYPNFRLLVRGHTGIRGDAEANQQLSLQRADSVVRYLKLTYAIDVNRMRAVGLGAAQPLPRQPGESSRAYNYRLPRVELMLVAEQY